MSAAVSSSRLPVFLDFAGRRAVVIGGGPVAARKAADLVEAGAAVVVVAPSVCEDLRDAIAAGQVVWEARDYRAGDLADAWFAVAATGSASVDDHIAAEAQTRRVWLVDAGRAGRSPVWGAARVELEDGVAVAVSGGRDPRRARAVAAAVRRSAADAGLPLRRRRAREGAESLPGRVYLVGGGPGHPDLITVRGSRLLALADVVVIDRLAPWQVLEDLEADVEVIDVGKAPGSHAMPQEQINELLVERALAGQVVVRLKGGDPFVLGRGGEEALACVEAGVPVEVVPGVTSAIAVPAAAGIPVTHRGVATSFTMASAHTAAEALEHASAAPVGSTLVLLMGVGRLGEVAGGLVAAGWPAPTPVATIERGWTPGQRSTFGTLADIAERAAERGVESPAVIVVGDVVDVGRRIGLGGG
ncbi:MAG: uroporphyrinogen-III C-methyltransferase [Candidatus Nanopelagicales bacterium]